METIHYVTSLLTFYLKGSIQNEQNFIKFTKPNTVLGLIPLGSKKENVPINQISSVTSNFKLKLLKLLLGVIAAIAGFSAMFSKGGFIGGLIILIIGANWILDAFEIQLQVNMTSGRSKLIDFFIFDKNKAELAEKQINALISNRLADTNTREQTDRIVGAIDNLSSKN
ncbi:MAG: hypothetical protein IKZ82_04035 [Clostridia bacterium]|nr:hypothetical protein [Clostridia bacterium]